MAHALGMMVPYRDRLPIPIALPWRQARWCPNWILILLLVISGSRGHDLSFTKPWYNATIHENGIGKSYVTSGERMGILVSDPGTQIRFRIAAGDKEKHFKAESRCVGDFCFLFLRTKTQYNALNRERIDLYKLRIRATMNGEVDLDTEAIVWVHILDTNDLSPFFSSAEYAVSLREDTALYGKVTEVHAEDADLGVNGQIYYQLAEYTEQFAVNPVTGVITLTRPLYLTARSYYELTVLAYDRGPQLGFVVEPARTVVKINITRVNKHDPYIEVRHMPELYEKALGNIYAVVDTEDQDLGPAGEIASLEVIRGDNDGHFQIVRHDPKKFHLVYNSVAASLPTYSSFNLTLRATDRGNPSRSSTKDIYIRLADTVNSLPFFEQESYAVSITELAPVNTLLLRPIKQHESRQSQLQLTITAGNEDECFRAGNGVLYTAKPLDYETRSEYALILTAKDPRTLRQFSAKVMLTVLDANDNDPLFPYKTLELQMEENDPAGTFVTQVTARDADSGENGYLSYSMANLYPVPFEIDPFTGVIRTTEILDYESGKRSYIVKVRASDWGVPYRRQTELIVRVFVKDINDNRPQFDTVNCHGKVGRTAPVGTELVSLMAFDFDEGSSVSYHIVWGNEDGCFLLNPNNGTLTVNCDLSELGIAERFLNVTATDGLHFADVTTVTISLVQDAIETILECRSLGLKKKLEERESAKNFTVPADSDVPLPMPARYGKNIHPPEFVSWPGVIHVNESIQPGTPIWKILAKDRDLGYNGLLVYVISAGDEEGSFQLDMDSGILRTLGILDRERRLGYALNITVYDLGKPQKSVSKILQVVIDDVNDNAPMFERPMLKASVKENCQLGSVVAQLIATDPDEAENGRVSYRMISDTEDFCIDSESGLLTVAASLDRERMEFYRLLIVASDGGKGHDVRLSSTAVVQVTVTDVNDVPPQFAKTLQTVKVREDVPEGSVVAIMEASDPDSSLGGQILYSLITTSSWQPADHFSVDEKTGVVRLVRKLDYEDRQIYNLSIRAQDQRTPSLSSEAFLVVEVLDVNENIYAPRFDDFIVMAEVLENATVGTTVIRLVAHDDDPPGHDSSLMYYIKGGTGYGLFSIDNEGFIKTRVALDRETQPFYWLTVVAQDHGIVPLSSSVEVFVRVLDVNDHVPLTVEPIYWARVLENSPPDTPIVQLAVEDRDFAGNDNITYKISAGNPQSLFNINSRTGLISTTGRKLDRESQDEHVLEVAVSDNGTPALGSTTRVVIHVVDVNDNDPEFLERFYKIQIPPVVVVAVAGKNGVTEVAQAHNGLDALNEYDEEANISSTWITSSAPANDLWATAVYRVVAFDKDSGVNGQLEYSLTGTARSLAKFRIHPDYGIIYAQKTLRPGNEFTFKVKATDKGNPPRSAVVSLLLSVVAVPGLPNHPPEISGDWIRRADVMESDPVNHAVTFVHASDPDNDTLWFNIVGGNEQGKFGVHQRTGRIFLAGLLDSEETSNYTLNCSVTDGIHTVYTQVDIHVVDVNDQYPVFTEPVYKAEVSETARPGTEIVQLSARDADRDKRVFYAIHSASSLSSLHKFRIDSERGMVTLADAIDSEVMSEHVLTVLVKDHGTPSNRNYARLVITVTDHNDHAPEFPSELTQVRVYESAAPGTVVTRVQAIDRDRGLNSKLAYSVISGNTGGMFSVEPDSGSIRTEGVLDATENHEYMLVVMATDSGIPALSTTCRVHVLVTMAENDPPKFSMEEFLADVPENSGYGDFVIQLETRSASSLFYEIVNDDGTFNINPATGIVTTKGRIDYEGQSVYYLTVQATNVAGKSSTCRVIIHILDVNDNAPRLSGTTYEGFIFESLPMGSLVLRNDAQEPLCISATDRDSGPNSLLSYDINERYAASLFTVDPHTGAIRTSVVLDREQTDNIEFTVAVRDNGMPRLYAENPARVKIHVVDINDNPPRFINEPYNATLIVPAFDGIYVLRVPAVDPDEGVDNALSYEILSGNSDGTFTINQTSGVISVRNADDLRESYSLEVSASDGIFTGRTSVQIVTTLAADASGFAFTANEYNFNISENVSKVEKIAILNVVGNSLEEHVTFSILNPSSWFDIGPSSGLLATTGIPFDRESQARHVVVVQALVQSKEGPGRIGRTRVVIHVMDVNDNRPAFVSLPYYSAVATDAPKGTVITKIQAVDRDIGENGRVRYALIRGNGELFRVHPRSGEISLLQNLDGFFAEYQLVVSAFDAGTPRLSSETSVHVRVLQRSAPVFLQQYYEIQIDEGAPIHSAVIGVRAIPDANASSALVYSISGGNENEEFDVQFNAAFGQNNAPCVIHVAAELDYELRHGYQLQLRATDPVSGAFSQAILSVNVRDVNDVPPRFSQSEYNVTVAETATPGMTILQLTAYDQDSGKNGEINYSLSGGDGDFFEISAVEGFLRLKKPLDFESKTIYDVRVIATDSGIPALSSTANVLIYVEDVNDNAPRFESPSYSVSLSELAQRGQFVTQVRALDPDVVDRSRLFYFISAGNDYQVFTINSTTGTVYLANVARLTSRPIHVLNMSVTDGVFSSFAHLNVELVSANLNAPQFVKAVFDCELPENQPAGTRVVQILATDPDRGSYGRLKFSITSEPAERLFRIDETTGEIFTKDVFDRELHKWYDIAVTVTDGGGKMGHAVVRLKISDLNDNKPRFLLSNYRANVLSDTPIGRTFLKVQAVDPDADSAGKVRYSVYDSRFDPISSMFSINSSTGELSLTRSPVNFEGQTFQFFIRAEDEGLPPQSSEVPVEVVILGEDDEPPIFEKNLSKFFILESAALGTIVAHITAVSTERVTYEILDGIDDVEDIFGIDTKGQLHLLKPLDRETAEVYVLTVQASTESSARPLIATTEVVIYVMDANEHPPEFESSTYEAVVAENAEKGMNIVRVVARDKDRALGSHGDLRYSFSPDSVSLANIFRLDSDTGWISTLVALDREETERYNFSVVAADNGTPNKLYSTASVVITVKDFNDNPSEFTRSRYFAALGEDTPVGTVVLQLGVTDRDLDPAEYFEFYIIDGDQKAQFGVRSTGELFVARQLDREEKETYYLRILVTDGLFTDTATVTVEIVDVNDNPPICRYQEYKEVLPENVPAGTFVLQVRASDADTGENARMKFSLEGEGSDHFLMDPNTGQLRVAKPLDRELKPQYRLSAKVSDRNKAQFHCVTEILITVTDINDNAPQFPHNLFVATIPEDAKSLSPLIKIRASDKDLASNAKIRYSLIDTADGHFTIDTASGLVTLVKTLDRETVPVYNITVLATDAGIPALNSSCTVTVIVLDVNDNPPEFEMKLYSAELPENADVGTEVLQVTAVSLDTGINAELAYSIAGNDHLELFRIDANSGIITIVRHLDYEESKFYLLTVEAIDRGTPPLKGYTSVNISVIDINDNVPAFSLNSYSSVICEDAVRGTSVIKLSAEDPDSHENGRIKFRIIGGDRHAQFHIDDVTGVISVASQIDREMVPSYELVVEAQDFGIPSLSSNVTVSVEVCDTNDNPPLFSQHNFSAVAQEDKPLGFAILQFTVTDLDGPGNAGPFVFDVLAGNIDNAFRVDSDGQLRTAANLNHRIRPVYSLQVRVFDNGSPTLYSDTWVEVTVVEESKYPPSIAPMEVSVNSLLDEYSGGVIGKVYAADPDPHDTVRYSVTNPAAYFEIDPEDGTLIAKPGLDCGFYSVNVSATDGKFTSYRAIPVTINHISPEVLTNAVTVTLKEITPEEFLVNYRRNLPKAFRSIMGIRTKDTVILSIQPQARNRTSRDLPGRISKVPWRIGVAHRANLDILLAVQKTQTVFYSPALIRQQIVENLAEFESVLGHRVARIPDGPCVASVCANGGNCIDRIDVDDTLTDVFSTGDYSFVSLRHKVKAECVCRPGFKGESCQDAIDPCTATGSCYQTTNPLYFTGNSYVHLALTAVDRRMTISLRLRTFYSSGSVLYAKGSADYSVLELVNGQAQFRFDCGSGEGVVRVPGVVVNDGLWHQIVLERHGNKAELTVDSQFQAQGMAPGVGDVRSGEPGDFFVGAEVAGSGEVKFGFVGCMDDVRINHVALPSTNTSQISTKTAILKRFFNVEFSCKAILERPGICGSRPCLNGASCYEKSNSSYDCHCSTRYAGPHCEIDTDPCASSPCHFDGICRNLFNDYYCECPPGLTGKRCEYGRFCHPNPCKNGGVCEEGPAGPVCKCRGFTGDLCSVDINECERNPCQNSGTCVNIVGGFQCICAVNTTGHYCSDSQYSVTVSGRSGIMIEEVIGIVVAATVLLLLALLFVLCQRVRSKRNRSSNERVMVSQYDSKELVPLKYQDISGKDVQEMEDSLKNNHYEEVPMLPPRPTSYIPLNNLDTVRSYGSAADDLETYPMLDRRYKANLNGHAANLHSPPLARSDSLSDDEQCWQDSKGSYYDVAKIRNDLKDKSALGTRTTATDKTPSLPPLSRNSHALDDSSDGCGKLNVVQGTGYCDSPLPTPPPTPPLYYVLKGLKKETNLGTDETSINCTGYHWDCSDWASQNHSPAPNITELGGSEKPDSSSYHSNDSNDYNQGKSSDGLASSAESFLKVQHKHPISLSSFNDVLQGSLSAPSANSLQEAGEPDSVYTLHPDYYLPPYSFASETDLDCSADFLNEIRPEEGSCARLCDIEDPEFEREDAQDAKTSF